MSPTRSNNNVTPCTVTSSTTTAIPATAMTMMIMCLTSLSAGATAFLSPSPSSPALTKRSSIGSISPSYYHPSSRSRRSSQQLVSALANYYGRLFSKSQSLLLLLAEGEGGDLEFDPLLSPHSYPDGIDNGSVNDPLDGYGGYGVDGNVANVIGMGFSSDDGGISDSSSSANGSGGGSYGSGGSDNKNNNNKSDFDFDPLLSPHSYPDGIDAGPVPTMNEAVALYTNSVEAMMGGAGVGQEETQEEEYEDEETVELGNEEELCDPLSVFDPLLSPHEYPDGIPSLPTDCIDESGSNIVVDTTTNENNKETTAENSDTQTSKKTGKLGILLIDHGSKRQASNDNLHSIAAMYQSRLMTSPSTNNNDISNDDDTSSTNTNANDSEAMVVVRGAHMEIATPSILTSLRTLLQQDQVERIVCVPYFLSPGRHATVDVPNLIEEAKDILGKEGLLTLKSSKSDNGGGITSSSADDDNDGVTTTIPILVSNALGSHLESMLGAVDDLVEWTLDRE